MTAVNVVRHRDAIHVMTDGAGFSADGTVQRLIGKANILPVAPAIIVVRGLHQYGAMIAHRAHVEGWSFDDIVQQIVPLIKKLPDELLQLLPAARALDPGFDLTLVGYSQRNRRFEHWSLPAHHRYPPESGVKAWQLNECPETMYAMPGPPSGHFEGFECPDADEFDPIFHGIRLMEAQRKIRFPLDYRNPEATHHGVGGFVQLTTLTKDGITSRIILRWPDKIGEKINPFASH